MWCGDGCCSAGRLTWRAEKEEGGTHQSIDGGWPGKMCALAHLCPNLQDLEGTVTSGGDVRTWQHTRQDVLLAVHTNCRGSLTP